MHFPLFVFSIFGFLIKEVYSQCNFTYGDYTVNWIVDRSNFIRFRLVKQRMLNNMWTAIAFGPSMPIGLDIAMIKVMNSQVYISDESVYGRRPPFVDTMQDIQVQYGSWSNGVLQASFSRPIWAVEHMYDRAISGCAPWHFIPNGGFVHNYYHVGKHAQHPIFRHVCIDQCRI